MFKNKKKSILLAVHFGLGRFMFLYAVLFILVILSNSYLQSVSPFAFCPLSLRQQLKRGRFFFDAGDKTEPLRDVCKSCGITVEFAKSMARKTNIESRENQRFTSVVI